MYLVFDNTSVSLYNKLNKPMLTGNTLHLQQLKQGREAWNSWKDTNLIRPDLKGFNLDGMDLSGYHLDQSDFSDASMIGCNLNDAWLTWCVFIRTKLNNSTMISPVRETFDGDKRLLGVNLRWSSFADTDLTNVDMRGATLEAVRFHHCNFRSANLSGSDVYGVSAWGNDFDEHTIQEDLVITQWKETILTVDNIELAQFIYSVLNSNNVRGAINTLTTKIVLILGSFAETDKLILDSIKRELRFFNLVPMMFDFGQPHRRNKTETVSTLAHLSKFIVADLTNQRSVPHELASILPHLRSVPTIPIIRDEEKAYGMFGDFNDLKQVSPIINYNSNQSIKSLVNNIIESAHTISQSIHNLKLPISTNR